MILNLFLILICSNLFNQYLAHFISNRENINESDKIESLENQALIEGDILPNLNEKNQTNSQQNLYHAVSLKKSKWKNGIINFKLDKNFYDDEIDKIINAMYKIEKVSCVRFRPKPVHAIDYVKLIKGSGCYSSAGRSGGMQILSLGKGCLNTGTILHELLHTVGFYHTHQRSDRDKYLNIHFNNMKKEYRSQFFKLPKSNVKLLTPFDYQSIMIYGSKAFSKNDRPTMTPKFKFTKSKKPIHLTYPFKKSRLTKYDVLSINRLYKCTKKAKKRSSLLFYSNFDNDDDDEDDEVEFPQVDEIKVDQAKEDGDDDEDESERLEKERKEKERLEKDRKEKEKLEKERLEKERLEKERLEKDRKEKERLEKERFEKERLKEKLSNEKKLKLKEKEKKEKIKLNKEKKLREKLEKEKQLKLKLNTINLKDKSKYKLIKNKEQKKNKKQDHNKNKNDLNNDNNQNNNQNNSQNNSDEYIKKDENLEYQNDEINEKIEVQVPVDLTILNSN